jgi:site-specific DNA-methyltransferase (adenine-specific)
MQVTDKIRITNEDNMALMSRYPDNEFDLAIVDPPYDFSIGDKTNFYVSQGKYNKTQETRPKGGFKIGGNYMDSIQKAPDKTYFKELQRISKNQIIFGGNYFTDILKPTTCWIVWDKMNGENYFGDFEMAWTSFGKANRMFKKVVHEPNRIHPTQKPVALYKWILDKYAKPNDKILDTHGGSMSIAIACHDYDFELTLCELDEEYYKKGIERIKNHVSQQRLF